MVQISIIIVSYNTRDITDKCLTCVENSDFKNIEIIVVDNASSDGTIEMIKKNHLKTKLIASKTNIGFTGGNNLGMKEAKGDFILLLNSDAFLEPETLNKCLKYMDTHVCDVMGCKLTFADGKLQPSAGALPNPINIMPWLLGLPNSYHPKKVQPGYVGWITGAFMFFRRDVYDHTSGFDEAMFMYGEEIEWCKRISDAKYKISYDPSFQITHLQGASGGQAIVREMEGIKYYFQKYHPMFLFWLKLWIFAGASIRVILKPQMATHYKKILREL